jgi:hypothetical protein
MPHNHFSTNSLPRPLRRKRRVLDPRDPAFDDWEVEEAEALAEQNDHLRAERAYRNEPWWQER